MKVLILSTIVGLGACAPDLFSGPPHHPHHSPYAPAPYHPAPAPYHPAPHYAPDPYEKLAPRPYAYEFGVQDHYSGADFAKKEVQDDHGVVTGEYRVALPDGRIQIVTYHADHIGGFVADVKYEGVPVYPEPAHHAAPYHAAPAPYAPAPYAPRPIHHAPHHAGPAHFG